ncbi:hypothetical protein TPA0910_06600 [Streptomyces hygroscopicus subsp. sporocinereus]|uniref:Uncharacterized protein n=1 Tax=Streptomyces hygroscopicus TaxID=1912 RepID=A0ABQ3TSA7_STRHY|nr:hypothetical protein TPA0910_06600 [Streptomyces hygroscopicus]GLV72896.1 hypothetical protein Shyhy02_08990 [Streptomyces hygroscopicus subsp. hygroscopicus]
MLGEQRAEPVRVAGRVIGARPGPRPPDPFRVVQHGHRPGVGQHHGAALLGVGGVDREVRPAGLRHRQLGHHQFGRAGQDQGDHPLRSHALSDEVVGQPVGPALDLAEGPLMAVRQQGGRLGGAPRPRGEQLAERCAGYGAVRGVSRGRGLVRGVLGRGRRTG